MKLVGEVCLCFLLDLSVFCFFCCFFEDHPWRWFWRVKRVSEHVADNAWGWTAAPAKHRTDTCSDDWLHIWTFKQAFAPLLKCSSKLPGNQHMYDTLSTVAKSEISFFSGFIFISFSILHGYNSNGLLSPLCIVELFSNRITFKLQWMHLNWSNPARSFYSLNAPVDAEFACRWAFCSSRKSSLQGEELPGSQPGAHYP